jgi:hypothetical protein
MELVAPFSFTRRRVQETGDAILICEGHRAQGEIGYSHLEKLQNLEMLPADGFEIVCYPRGGASRLGRLDARRHDSAGVTPRKHIYLAQTARGGNSTMHRMVPFWGGSRRTGRAAASAFPALLAGDVAVSYRSVNVRPGIDSISLTLAACLHQDDRPVILTTDLVHHLRFLPDDSH